MQPRSVTEPHPVVSITLALAVGLVGFLVPWSCAGGQLTPLNQCRLSALEVLPSDPNMATAHDAVDIIERLIACQRAQTDGGP